MDRRWFYAAQSLYYTVTGLWPLLSIGTFMAVTGPKRDIWLVKMVGSLVVVNGVTMGMAARQARSDDRLPMLLCAASAVAFIGIDVVYTARRTIRPVYLGDAVVQLGLLAGLALSKR